MGNSARRAKHPDAAGFLAPILSELGTRQGRSSARGLPPVGLAVRTRLLDAPPDVEIVLTRLVESAPVRGVSKRRDVALAVQLLGALQARRALPALFELAVRLAEDPTNSRERGSPVFGSLAQAFADFGDSIVAALVPFLAGNERDIGLLLILAAGTRVADDRLLTMFVEALAEHPCEAASALLCLGDRRALDPLRRRLTRLPAHGIDNAWCVATLSLTHAIEELGGELSEADQRKADDALELHRVLYAAAASAANARDRALHRCDCFQCDARSGHAGA